MFYSLLDKTFFTDLKLYSLQMEVSKNCVL
jgi:hypothetical protein